MQCLYVHFTYVCVSLPVNVSSVPAHACACVILCELLCFRCMCAGVARCERLYFHCTYACLSLSLSMSVFSLRLRACLVSLSPQHTLTRSLSYSVSVSRPLAPQSLPPLSRSLSPPSFCLALSPSVSSTRSFSCVRLMSYISLCMTPHSRALSYSLSRSLTFSLSLCLSTPTPLSRSLTLSTHVQVARRGTGLAAIY